MNRLRPFWILIQEDTVHEQKYIHSPVVSVGRVSKTPAGRLLLERQNWAWRNTQSVAPTSTVPTLNSKHDWQFRPLIFTEKPNAWLCCVCSTNHGSCCDCGYQRLSSRMNCGCNFCRRSNYCSGSGWCCGSDCDCDCGWRYCSMMTRWRTDCWRKDLVGSKVLVASWHCGEPKMSMVWNWQALSYDYQYCF